MQAQNAVVPASTPDSQIAAILKTVSPERIQQTIDKLVSFQSRHTLSSEVPASSGKGINAAAEWITSELQSYSKACGGCLEVKTDEFTQDTSNRIPKPTKLTNVYAVLRGSDPANASRIVLVSGHYDSRATETNDFTSASPGANDDGSGTAVSMECARVLSQHKFPATIIFLIVAGEEQGLYGSAHFAKMAKAQGWNIEAVLNNDIVGGDKSAWTGPAHGSCLLRGHPGQRHRSRTQDDPCCRRRERRRIAATRPLYRLCLE